MFSFSEIADKTVPLPNMMPSDEVWRAHMARLDIDTQSDVVLYDDFGNAGACRVYHMFKVFNPDHKVYILDSSFPALEEKHRHLVETAEVTQPAPKPEDASFQRSNAMIADFDLAQQASYSESVLKKDSFVIIDARGAERFEGKTPEPREGLRAGHIAGSVNIPFRSLLNADYSFKSKEELESVYQESGVDVESLGSKLIINTCGSGVTACVNLVAQELMEVSKRAVVYDGSWTEYGQHPEYDNEEMHAKLQKKVCREKKPMKVELQAGKMYSYCICGKSESQPMCDSRHRGSDFRSMKFAVEEDKAYYLCMCRQSKNLPYCDGSHKQL